MTQAKKRFLFYGDDLEGINNEISAIESGGSFERINLSASENSATEIISQLNARSLFSQDRIILIRDCHSLSRKEIEKIVEHHQHSEASDHLIFYSPKMDKKSPQVVFFAKCGAVKEFVLKAGLPLKRSIEETFAQFGKRPDPAITEALMHISLSDPGKARDLAQQICLYFSDSADISPSEIREFIGSSPESNLFKMIDALFHGKREIVFSTFEHLIAVGEEPAKMLFLITRHLKILLALNDPKAKNSITEASRKFRIPGFAADGYSKQSRRFSRKSLIDSLNLAQKADWQIKGGSALSGSQIVELLLVKILSLQRKRK